MTKNETLVEHETLAENNQLAELVEAPSTSSGTRSLDHLDALESESIHIFREIVGELERPVLLFSGGKDSVVMLHLATKARPLPGAARRHRPQLR